MGLGRSRQILDLTGAKRWDDIVAQVRKVAATRPAGTWILGRGWHQEKWLRPPRSRVQGYPTHVLLSRAVPDHPVLLTHASGHMCLANAKAMQLARVDANTPDPSGGEILRDREGQPTGVFRETAQGLVGAHADMSPLNGQHPDDIPRFARLGVTAAMQGIHCTSDAVFVVDRLGERRAREGAYAWQALLRSDALVINGTDAPVEGRRSPEELLRQRNAPAGRRRDILSGTANDASAGTRILYHQQRQGCLRRAPQGYAFGRGGGGGGGGVNWPISSCFRTTFSLAPKRTSFRARSATPLLVARSLTTQVPAA